MGGNVSGGVGTVAGNPREDRRGSGWCETSEGHPVTVLGLQSGSELGYGKPYGIRRSDQAPRTRNGWCKGRYMGRYIPPSVTDSPITAKWARAWRFLIWKRVEGHWPSEDRSKLTVSLRTMQQDASGIDEIRLAASSRACQAVGQIAAGHSLRQGLRVHKSNALNNDQHSALFGIPLPTLPSCDHVDRPMGSLVRTPQGSSKIR